jgi:hypothetical protein
MAEKVVTEEVVITRRRTGRPIAWRPRVVRGGRSRDRSVDPEARGVIPAIAVGLALLLVIELQIRAIESPTSVPHQAMGAHRVLGAGSMNP